MGTIANAIPGLRTTQRVAVREDNVGPRGRLQASQGGQLVRSGVASGGAGEVPTLAGDVTGDGLTFDWSGPDAELREAHGQPDTFTFDPAELAAGVYQVSVRADDGVEQGASSLLLKVVSSAPVLGVDDSDGDGVLDFIEGAGDSDNDGVAEYLDAFDASNVLQARLDVDQGFLLEADPGLQLALGAGSFAVGDGARVTPAQVADAFGVALPAVLASGAQFMFDVEISELGEFGDSVQLVVPLTWKVPFGGRLYLLAGSDWVVMSSDSRNQLASA